MNYERIADLLFPHITTTPEDIEARFADRDLPEGAKVTRLAPSPTGFIHLGGAYQALLDERLAHQSGGVFFLRIEDTDSKREVPGAARAIVDTLGRYNISFDEGVLPDGQIGAYGPYKQSERVELYQTFAKELVRQGKAYPCFTTQEELDRLNQTDKKAELAEKDWHADDAQHKEEMLQLRNITEEEIEANIKAGNPFVLRVLADGDPEKKVPITDLIKGKLELPENDEDFVLLKSDGIPTYHFAHAVDDHLMRTTHVIRGEEWLPSLPKHLMLFRYLGFKLPKYLHTAQIMRLDENGNKKKLSKRDMGANVDDYREMGYAPICVIEYLMTILNSNYEEWHMQNPDKPYTDFPFSIKKMSTSGALFDMNKLNDVAKNMVSRMSAEEVYDYIAEWAKEFAPEFYDNLTSDRDYAIRVLSIGRGGKKPRKDYGTWREAKDYMALFYDDTFTVEAPIPDRFEKDDVRSSLTDFIAVYNESDDQNTWFEGMKKIAEKLGFSADMKAYKADPTAFKGSIGDISMFLRVAVTGKQNSPDLYEVMQILGYDRVISRVKAMLETL